MRSRSIYGICSGSSSKCCIALWEESKPLDQTRFIFSAIETRAAAQTDNSDMDVFGGGGGGDRRGKRWKEADRRYGESWSFCDGLICSLSNSRDKKKQLKTCWAKANAGQRKWKEKDLWSTPLHFSDITQNPLLPTLFYRGHMQLLPTTTSRRQLHSCRSRALQDHSFKKPLL